MPPDPTHPAPPGPAQRDWFVTTIPTSLGTEGFDVSPDWKELWSAAASDGKLWIIDTAERKVAASIDAKLNGANRLKFTPDGKRVLVSILSTGDLFVYDVASPQRDQTGDPGQRVRRYPGGSGRLTCVRGLHRSELRCSSGSEHTDGHEPFRGGRRTGRSYMGEATMMRH